MKHETEIMKNSTEMLCLEQLKRRNMWDILIQDPEIKNSEFKISQIILHSSINQHKKFMTSKYQNTTLINENC